MKLLSIIIPASNEERFIENTVNDILRNFNNVEVIVVCNNSKDNTFSVVERIKRKNKNVINLNLKKSFGKGDAILYGLRHVKNSKYIGFLDADGAFYIKDIKRAVKELLEYDCVIGSKWPGISFSDVNENFFTKVYSRLWNFIVNFLFNLKIKDTQAGMKFFRKKVLSEINRNSDKFICRRFDFDVELLHRIKVKDFNIKEIPVKIRKLDKKGSFSYKNSFSMLFNILRYRLVIEKRFKYK